MFCVVLCRVCIYYIILYTLSIRNARKRILGGPRAEAKRTRKTSRTYTNNVHDTRASHAKSFRRRVVAGASLGRVQIYLYNGFSGQNLFALRHAMYAHHIHAEYTRRRPEENGSPQTHKEHACQRSGRERQTTPGRESSASHRIATRIATARRVCRLVSSFPR